MNLQEILDNVMELWKFDEELFPDMKGQPSEIQKVMAVRHIFMKTLDIEPLREFIEMWERGHYRQDPYCHQLPNKLLAMARRQIFNYLRLLNFIGESGETLQWALTHPEEIEN